ncbi:MAG TPA: hypothetical protein DDW65_22060 [Firmicutes bacterium]|jgi:hypothetical protein|nr:hypothetical protein [Bacillota bacterium]
MKGIFWKEGESFSNSMSLIAFLLVRYPELGSVRFDPGQKTLLFSFVLIKSLTKEEFEPFKDKLLLSLNNMTQLQGRESETGTIEVNYAEYDGLTFLEIVRNIESLTQEEIALITGIIRESFEEYLLLDQDDTLQEEDAVLQEEMIEHMLEDLKDSRQEKRLIGFREEGRVLVFNRANLHK